MVRKSVICIKHRGSLCNVLNICIITFCNFGKPICNPSNIRTKKNITFAKGKTSITIKKEIVYEKDFYVDFRSVAKFQFRFLRKR